MYPWNEGASRFCSNQQPSSHPLFCNLLRDTDKLFNAKTLNVAFSPGEERHSTTLGTLLISSEMNLMLFTTQVGGRVERSQGRVTRQSKRTFYELNICLIITKLQCCKKFPTWFELTLQLVILLASGLLNSMFRPLK